MAGRSGRRRLRLLALSSALGPLLDRQVPGHSHDPAPPQGSITRLHCASPLDLDGPSATCPPAAARARRSYWALPGAVEGRAGSVSSRDVSLCVSGPVDTAGTASRLVLEPRLEVWPGASVGT